VQQVSSVIMDLVQSFVLQQQQQQQASVFDAAAELSLLPGLRLKVCCSCPFPLSPYLSCPFPLSPYLSCPFPLSAYLSCPFLLSA
jgi:hypothetical protein